MPKKNCLDCLFANITTVSMILFDSTNYDCRICEHPSSPMYDRYVNDNKYCNFYINEKEYFENENRTKII